MSGFENVNLYNGNLNFNLPLLQIGGRGGARTAMTASLDSVKWVVYREAGYSQGGGAECGDEINPCYRPPYESAYGGASTDASNMAGVSLQQGLRVGYGPGVLQGRVATSGPISGHPTSFLIRLTFTASDGTEYELLDLITHGRPTGNGWQPPAGHGWDYVSTDGTITFKADEQVVPNSGSGDGSTLPITGNLRFADGTLYRIDDNLVSWIRDRNGNKLSFSYYEDLNYPDKRRVHTITDSLGRVVTVNYADSSTPYDRIIFKAFGGAINQEIHIYRTTLSQALRQTRTGDLGAAQAFGDLFPELDQGPSEIFNPTDVISKIQLPDGRSYKLYYNVYNELARVELPTGGAIEYDYTPTGQSVLNGGVSWHFMRRVTERRVYTEQTATQYESRQTYTPMYTPTASYGSYVSSWETTVTVAQYGASGLLGSEKHYYFGSPRASLFKHPISYSGWKEAKEYKTEWFDATGTSLRRVENVWQQGEQKILDMSWWQPSSAQTPDHAPANNPQLVETKTTLLDVTPNLVSKQTFKYDKYSNLTDTFDYDYNPGVAATHPVRHTKTDYLTTNNGLNYRENINIHIRNLPIMQQMFAVDPVTGTESQMSLAKTETIYDEEDYLSPNYSAVTQWIAPATAGRGNATTVKKWYDLTSSEGYIDAHVVYDQCGNVRETRTLRQTVPTRQYSISKITYSPVNNTYAFPVETETPIPDSSGTYGSTSTLKTTNAYDFSTGLVTSTTDANNQTTTIEYDDPLNRPTRVDRPAGGGWTSYFYGDTLSDEATADNRYVRTQSALTSSQVTESYGYYDGLGRTTRALTKVGATWSAVDTKYDNLGRVAAVSNPYGSASLGSSINTSSSLPWTETTYDALGRVRTVKMPDGAIVSTSYYGAQTLVTDQSGRKRVSRTNGLGQLTDVWEITAADGATEAISLGQTSLNGYRTSYTYDLLGNLRKVEQGAQRRYFMYDSLSRLLYARNPEQGVIANFTAAGDALVNGNSQWSLKYTYDASGNLASRKDARGVEAIYAYDALNRNTTITYSDETPDITRRYDSAILGKGRLWQSETAGDAGTRVTISSYDALGRPLSQKQEFKTAGSWSAGYTVERSYGLAGQVTSQTYPSGHVVNYDYESDGRLKTFKGNLGDGVQREYASGIIYDEAGRIQQEKYGTMMPLYHKLRYNVRGQLYDVRLSTMSRAQNEMDWNRGCLAFSYSAQNPTWGQSGTDNNGNLIQADNYVPLSDGSYYQAQDTYSYDALNRLTQVAETGYFNGQAQGNFTQAYSYDRYGNRTINQTASSNTVGINRQEFTVDANTNRLGVPAGINKTMSYDHAGNLNFDSYSGKGQRSYDAENRMTSAADNSDQTSFYTYDADGRRVRRKTTVEGEVWQVYGMDGELVAEYAATASSFLPKKEYGYRAGQLLVTASSGDEQRLTRFIHQLYRGSLGRDATPTEQQQWFGWLAGQAAVSQSSLLSGAKMMAGTLLNSAEYGARNRTDRQCIQDLYWTYFGRGASQSEEDMWAGRLATGSSNPITREQLRVVCEGWGEFNTLVATLWGVSSTENERTEHFLWNMYLGATGAVPSSAQMQPDIDSLNTYSAQSKESVITRAREIARAQILDPAYTNRSRTDSQYVADLYQVFWQRTPDQSGWNYWTAQVASQGRATVLTSFANSTAFTEVAGTLYRETLWLIPDHLGTTRMIAERTGLLSGMKRHDYLPFGEEIQVGVNGRTATQGYVSDSVRQSFTSKERDSETGLDYFGARYYANTQGRFTGVDPYNIIFRKQIGRSPQERRQGFKNYILQPQAWNRYAYALNSPSNNVDLGGQCSAPAGLKPGQVGICVEAFIASRSLPGISGKLGFGDARTHSGTDEKLGARVRVDITLTRTADNNVNVSSPQAKPGASTAFVPSFSISALTPQTHMGTASRHLTDINTDSKGNTNITLTATALNGFAAKGIPGAPSEPIDFKINFIVTPDFDIGIGPDSARDGYPSIGIYKYEYDKAGNIVTTTIYEDGESSTTDDLAPPMEKKIPETKPK